MAWAKAKNPAYLFTVIFTVIAVMTDFFVTGMESARAAGFADTSAGSGHGQLDNRITIPIGEPGLLRKTAAYRFAPLRTEFHRIFGSCGTQGAAFAFCRSYVEAVSNTGHQLIKNPILLKLRI